MLGITSFEFISKAFRTLIVSRLGNEWKYTRRKKILFKEALRKSNVLQKHFSGEGENRDERNTLNGS